MLPTASVFHQTVPKCSNETLQSDWVWSLWPATLVTFAYARLGVLLVVEIQSFKEELFIFTTPSQAPEVRQKGVPAGATIATSQSNVMTMFKA